MALTAYAEDGLFAPRKVAQAFRTTAEDVARTLGLGKDSIQRKDRIRSQKTQRRMREKQEALGAD